MDVLVRRSRLLALLAGLAVVAVVAGAVGVQLLLENGFSARDEPTLVDAFIVRWWRRLAVPREERGTKNPLPATPEVLARGREHFAADCAACHGSDGRGLTRLGSGLYPKPPDLASAATQSLADGEIFWVIQNGVRLSGMPAWNRDSKERDQSTWEIVHFIRQLPRLSVKDVEATQAMQPRSPREIEADQAASRFLGEPAGSSRPSEDAHHEATLMGSVAGVDPVRLQVRTTGGASVSLLLDHTGPTKFVRGSQTIRAAEIRVGDRVVIRAVRDQDWWLAREVRLSRKETQP